MQTELDNLPDISEEDWKWAESALKFQEGVNPVVIHYQAEEDVMPDNELQPPEAA